MTQRHQRIVEQYALSFVGVHYSYGGQNPLAGLDCSGLTCQLMYAFGELPYGKDLNSQGQYQYFTRNERGVVLDEPELGALLFYGPSVKSIEHVTFALSQSLMIEAGGGDRYVNTRQDAALRGAFVRVRPVTWRRDLVAVVKPRYNLLK